MNGLAEHWHVREGEPHLSFDECQTVLKEKFSYTLPGVVTERMRSLENSGSVHSKYAYETFDTGLLIVDKIKADPLFFGPDFPTLSVEEASALLATLLASDVGKTGPRDAEQNEQTAVKEIFDLKIEFPNRSAADVLEECHAEGRLQYPAATYLKIFYPRLSSLPDTEVLSSEEANWSMKKLFRRHIYWTHDLFSEGGPEHAKANTASSLHHYFEKENPTSIDLVNLSGTDPGLALITKINILIDKYNAAFRRANKSVREAFAWTTAHIWEQMQEFPDFQERQNQYSQLNQEFIALAAKILPLELQRLGQI